MDATSTMRVGPITRRTVTSADVPYALFAPRTVFARVEDVPAYGWALVLLLVAMAGLGYATVETGLIDREVDRQVQEQIARLEREQVDVVERSALSKMIADARKGGEFLLLMARAQVVVARPLGTLATVLLIPATLYGIVALTGRKPEWHALVTICVFASFVDVAAEAVRLGLMLNFRTLDVDTSLALLTRSIDSMPEGAAKQIAAMSGLLSGLDPFRIWFWLVMIAGLRSTAQLRGWKVWATCILFWLLATGFRTAVAVGTAPRGG